MKKYEEIMGSSASRSREQRPFITNSWLATLSRSSLCFVSARSALAADVAASRSREAPQPGPKRAEPPWAAPPNRKATKGPVPSSTCGSPVQRGPFKGALGEDLERNELLGGEAVELASLASVLKG